MRHRQWLAAFLFAMTAGLPFAAIAQPGGQLLKEVWTGTTTTLAKVTQSSDSIALAPSLSGGTSFKAIAFMHPVIGGDGSARPIVAVDGTDLVAFVPGELTPIWTLKAGSELSAVHTVAPTPSGTVLFTGYSRRKRWLEIWEYDPSEAESWGSNPILRLTDTPQLTDAVFISAPDVAGLPALPYQGGGLLGVAGTVVVFFPTVGPAPAYPYSQMTTIFDARILPIKGGVQIQGVDLVRKTNTLLVTTSDRKVFVVALEPVPVMKSELRVDAGMQSRKCAASKTQRLLVRNASGGTVATGLAGTTSFVSDLACGDLLRFAFDDDAALDITRTDPTTPTAGLQLLAIGEGQKVLCPITGCDITSGFHVTIDAATPVELLVLQFELCDPRVTGAACTRTPGLNVIGDDVLVLNELLPPDIRKQLAEQTDSQGQLAPVTITIPPYMFAAGPNGRFGAVLVETDGAGEGARVAGKLTGNPLVGFHLGVIENLPRGTRVLDLLNQDLAAYAPDDNAFPTVRGFEATPVTVGTGSGRVGLRGFSIVTYGLQHDLNPNGNLPGYVPARAECGGLPSAHPEDPDAADCGPYSDTVLNYGSPPGLPVVAGSPSSCQLTLGSLKFDPSPNVNHYFVDLAACLFRDLETLLDEVKNRYPAFVGSYAGLRQRLDIAEDKLIKALNTAKAGGSSSASENFESAVTQLDNFDAAVTSAPFTGFIIYKNELLVRSEALKFNLRHRTRPSVQ